MSASDSRSSRGTGARATGEGDGGARGGVDGRLTVGALSSKAAPSSARGSTGSRTALGAGRKSERREEKSSSFQPANKLFVVAGREGGGLGALMEVSRTSGVAALVGIGVVVSVTASCWMGLAAGLRSLSRGSVVFS